MKSIYRFGTYGLFAGLFAFVSGCASEKISVDYVMPAKAVTDISKVNVAAIKVKANVNGNLAGDNTKNAGLVKQLLAMRLYKEGFYQVADDLWNNPEGAFELEKMIKEKDAGHGYATLAAMGQGSEKVVIELTLDLELDSRPVQKNMAYTLKTIPYKDKIEKDKKTGNLVVARDRDGVPVREPDFKHVRTQTVNQPVTVYELVAKGTLKAMFKGVNGNDAPAKYENTFTITVPKADRFDSAQPSQLKALAAVVTPAVNGVVADISPYKKTLEMEATAKAPWWEILNSVWWKYWGTIGDERVVYLLNAKAFPEVVTVVEELEKNGKATFADFENQGIAFEAMGEFFNARDAYAKAEKAKPESETAKAGSRRVADALAGQKAVKESGAKQNKDTKFSK